MRLKLCMQNPKFSVPKMPSSQRRLESNDLQSITRPRQPLWPWPVSGMCGRGLKAAIPKTTAYESAAIEIVVCSSTSSLIADHKADQNP